MVAHELKLKLEKQTEEVLNLREEKLILKNEIEKIKHLQEENKNLIQTNNSLALVIAKFTGVENFTCMICEKEIGVEDKGIINIVTLCSEDCKKEALKKQKEGENQ